MESNIPIYHKPALDEYLAQHFEEIKQHVIINAQHFAQKNLPPIDNEDAKSYFEEDHLRYQALVDWINKEIQFKNRCHEVVEHEKHTEEQKQIIHNKLVAAKEKQVLVNANAKNRKRPYNRLRLTVTWIIVATNALFEGFLAFPVFQAYGYVTAEAFFMSLLFAAVLAIFAHVFEHIVLLGKKQWQRWAIAITLLLLLVGMFGYMAQARAEYLSKQVAANSADEINMHFSPIPFMLTSILLFIVSVAVCHFFMPNREQRNAMREYQRLQKEKQDNETEQHRLEQALSAKEQEHVELKKANASLLEYGRMLEELVISNAYGGFALWKKQNTMNRKDNARPKSFDEQSYPFTFNTNFHSLKLL